MHPIRFAERSAAVWTQVVVVYAAQARIGGQLIQSRVRVRRWTVCVAFLIGERKQMMSAFEINPCLLDNVLNKMINCFSVLFTGSSRAKPDWCEGALSRRRLIHLDQASTALKRAKQHLLRSSSLTGSLRADCETRPEIRPVDSGKQFCLFA